EYGELTNLFRPAQDQMRYFPYLLIAHIFAAFAFVWIYFQIMRETPTLAQGARYGLAVAALAIVPRFLIYYAVQPMPASTVCKQIVLDTLGAILMGIVVAALNRGAPLPADG
ncbi:MAG: hypothetical protein ACREMY_15865, partial [bacterium]